MYHNKTENKMKDTELLLDGKIEDLISQLQELLGTNGVSKKWNSDNKTNRPDEYGLKAGGYFDGENELHKIEIKIRPKKS